MKFSFLTLLLVFATASLSFAAQRARSLGNSNNSSKPRAAFQGWHSSGSISTSSKSTPYKTISPATRFSRRK